MHLNLERLGHVLPMAVGSSTAAAVVIPVFTVAFVFLAHSLALLLAGVAGDLPVPAEPEILNVGASLPDHAPPSALADSRVMPLLKFMVTSAGAIAFAYVLALGMTASDADYQRLSAKPFRQAVKFSFWNPANILWWADQAAHRLTQLSRPAP